MTTLDVNSGQLRTAVAPYPIVKDLQVSTQFPHGMRIHVVEQLPVGGRWSRAGSAVAVAGDGTLLHDVAAPARCRRSRCAVAARAARGRPTALLSALALLAATPYQLLAQISEVTTTAAHGLVAQLRYGPSIYFGDASRARARSGPRRPTVLADSELGGRDVHRRDRPGAPGRGRGSRRRRRESGHDRLARRAPDGASRRPDGATRDRAAQPRPGRSLNLNLSFSLEIAQVSGPSIESSGDLQRRCVAARLTLTSRNSRP